MVKYLDQLDQNNHGVIYNVLLYSAICSTIFLISYLKPPRFWKKITTFFLNISFTWRGATWKLYNVLAFFIFLLAILLICKYPLTIVLKITDNQLYANRPVVETHENKIFRLKHKWLLESEIWLTTLMIIEWL
jgi:hypothetical protein